MLAVFGKQRAPELASPRKKTKTSAGPATLTPEEEVRATRHECLICKNEFMLWIGPLIRPHFPGRAKLMGASIL